MHALKTGLNADKFATFPKRFYHSFVLPVTLIASTLTFAPMFDNFQRSFQSTRNSEI